LKSQTTAKFRSLLDAAAPVRRAKIRSAYRLWRENPAHPSLRFKKVHPRLPIYSVRVDLNWRAVGVLEGETVLWFWVGPHSEYEALLKAI
jgi:hypothetical protein